MELKYSKMLLFQSHGLSVPCYSIMQVFSPIHILVLHIPRHLFAYTYIYTYTYSCATSEVSILHPIPYSKYCKINDWFSVHPFKKKSRFWSSLQNSPQTNQTTLVWNPTKKTPRWYHGRSRPKNLPKKGPIHPSPNGYVSSCGHAIVVAWSDISWAGEVVRCFKFNMLSLKQFFGEVCCCGGKF